MHGSNSCHAQFTTITSYIIAFTHTERQPTRAFFPLRHEVTRVMKVREGAAWVAFAHRTRRNTHSPPTMRASFPRNEEVGISRILSTTDVRLRWFDSIPNSHASGRRCPGPIKTPCSGVSVRVSFSDNMRTRSSTLGSTSALASIV